MNDSRPRLFKTLPVETLRPENIGQRDDANGQRQLAEYVALRKKYIGKVLRVDDTEMYQSRGWDDGDNVRIRTVTVCDSLTGAPKILNAEYYILPIYSDKVGSAWDVDATDEIVKTYRRWVVMVRIPENAADKANQARLAAQDAANKKVAEMTSTAPVRGQVYEVVAGRKYPLGLRGVLFWWGNNKFGVTYGLSTSDRKLPNGRNADVIFVNPRNLKRVLSDEALKAAQEVRESVSNANLDKDAAEVYAAEVARQIALVAKEWGLSEDVVRSHTETLVHERVEGLKKRSEDINHNAWACDGPAYRQVEKTSEDLDRSIKFYERYLNAFAVSVSVAA